MADVRPSFGADRLAEETRERFVREILTRVPLARLVELHLFAPIRQGGVESGVAVLATHREGEGVEAAPVVEAPAESSAESPAALPVADLGSELERADPTDAAAGPAPETADGAETPMVPDAPDAPDESHGSNEAGDAAPLDAVELSPPPVARRHTVFTARYRLVLKGPERGRWHVEVREEADAPLVTVEAVVRGVQRRAGDAAGPERLEPAAIARLLDGGAPTGARLPGT